MFISSKPLSHEDNKALPNNADNIIVLLILIIIKI